jgi:hypothetical protein
MSCTRLAGGWAVSLLLLAPGFASAAWDNVFQLTCCGNTPRTSAYASNASPCCPQPAPCCPQTAYVQRSYYQPVTTYKPVVSCEPVVSYRTSYYYEPVQSCTYSCYVDPCTGCSRQVASPVTSYYLRSKCDAVTSYVQRVSYQPVVAYRQSFYYDPVTVTPSCSACAAPPPACPTCSASAPQVAPSAPQVAPSVPQVGLSPPVVNEQSVPPSSPPPPLNLSPAPAENRTMPGPYGSDQVNPNTSRPVRPVPANIRPDRVASRGSNINGTVVRDSLAQPNVRLRFVSAAGQEFIPAQADATGKFQVSLASGSWRVYTEDATGRPNFHSDIQIRDGDYHNVVLVAR